MPGPIYRFLADDHARLDGLLRRAISKQGRIDETAYAQFHAGLLKHIAVEEKILLPFAQEKRSGEALPIAAKLRLDHGALAALLVPTPTARIIGTVRIILEGHNPIEEGTGGLYETCEALVGPEVTSLLGRVRSAPEVRVAPHVDNEVVFEATRAAVERAG